MKSSCWVRGRRRTMHPMSASLRLIASCCLVAAVGCARQTSPSAQPASSAAVSVDAARQTALTRVPGQVLEEELEHDDGRLVYEFDIRPTAPGVPDQEVVADATTGQVLEVDDD